jgi:hypothetical protein
MAGTGELRVLAIEKLTGMFDYNSWAYAMQMYLIHEDLFDYVTGDMADSENHNSVACYLLTRRIICGLRISYLDLLDLHQRSVYSHL